MLNRVINNRIGKLFFITKYKFSGDSHGHHDYTVHIDKNAHWINYNKVKIL
jgi:hypothetical protein